MRRVVVTGLGAITSLGSNVDTSWQNLISGKSGIKKIPDSLFSTEDLKAKIAGYIPSKEEDPINGINPLDHVDGTANSMDRFIQLALIAADEAIMQSAWQSKTEIDAARAGVLIGSGIGGLINIERNSIILKEKGSRRINPYFIPASLVNLISGYVSIKHNLKGPNFSIVSACASGAHSIGESARIIERGDADMMVAGGSEAAICPLGMAGFAAARTLSVKYNDAPEMASRPWDRDRDGFVMGEGAGVVVLEELEAAKKRGANILVELTGYGLTGDAYHITSPESSGDGGYRAMDNAIKQSNISPDHIDMINAHSTSTPVGDPIEISAIKRLFNRESVCATANKAAIGHLLGAAGSVEAVFSIKSIMDNIIPPTLNLDNVDEQCTGIHLVKGSALEKKINHALSNSFGFGGTNAALLFSAYQN